FQDILDVRQPRKRRHVVSPPREWWERCAYNQAPQGTEDMGRTFTKNHLHVVFSTKERMRIITARFSTNLSPLPGLGHSRAGNSYRRMRTSLAFAPTGA